MHSFSRRALSALLDSSSAISDQSVLGFLAAHEVGGGGGGGGVMYGPLVVEVGWGWQSWNSLLHPPLHPAPVQEMSLLQVLDPAWLSSSSAENTKSKEHT